MLLAVKDAAASAPGSRRLIALRFVTGNEFEIHKEGYFAFRTILVLKRRLLDVATGASPVAPGQTLGLISPAAPQTRNSPPENLSIITVRRPHRTCGRHLLVQFDGNNLRCLGRIGGFNILHLGWPVFQVCARIEVLVRLKS